MRTLIVAAAFAAVSVCAQAADLKVKEAAALPVKAPLPPAYDPYTGFYLGAEIGYGWDRGNLGASFPGGPADFGDLSNAPQGALGGIYTGFGTRVPGFLAGLGLDAYLGIEGNGDWGNISGTAATPGLPFANGVVASTNDRWLASARGRFGLIYQNVMFYGTAGWGWGSTTLNVTTVAPGAAVGVPVGTNKTTENGFAWGGGIEFPWFFGPNWKARFQYLQYDFGTNVACIITTCGLPTQMAVTQKNQVDEVTVGVSYKF